MPHSFIASVSSENDTMSAAVVGPIVGKLKGMSNALVEYLKSSGKLNVNVNVVVPQ